MDYLIEIALNRYTDFSKFEELATRILTDEGYDSIHAIGGIGDMGMDAEEVRHYTDETNRTVFQYSLDKRNKQKVISTIDKLIDKKIQFQSVVFVTINQINNTETIKSEIRKKYKNQFEISIIERKTIIARLSHNNYHLFNTYFPNFRAQIENTLFNKKVYFSEGTSDILETSLLKCSLLFTFNSRASNTRKDLFDKLILSIVVSSQSISVVDIISVISKKYSRVFDEHQIKTSIQRLQKQDFINETDHKYGPSKKAIEYIEGNVHQVEESTDALIADILEKVNSTVESSIDKSTISKIKNNIKNSLSAFFRLHGVDYTTTADGNSDFGFEQNKALIEITKQGLSEKISSNLIYAIGDTIKNPTDVQAETLSHWSKAFISLQILNLDPALKEFQSTNFSKKTFIIDTDFLLNCLVEECTISKICRRLINQLKSLNCKMIIPKEVIAEVIKHGEAENNYNYFKSAFNTVDEKIIDEKVHNVFVKGYYTGLLNGTISKTTTFRTYLTNYINKDSPFSFLVELIEYRFPATFIIEELTTLGLGRIDQGVLDGLTELINAQTKNTFKAQWRSEDENYEVSYNDAKMYLTTYYLNEKTVRDKKAILPGSFYLLGSSSRAARCGLKLGLSTSISVKPETLIGLLEQLGSFELSSKEYVNIFENPYLVEIANDCWSDIKVLIDAGVDLKDKNPVNLRFELKDTIHQYIIERNKFDNKETVIEEEKQEEVELRDFIKFTRHVKSKGYKFTPSIEQIIDKFKEMQTDIQDKDSIIKELTEKSELFGKRKQKYLERIASKKKA